MAKVPDPLLYDELPEEDKALIAHFVNSRRITLREMERLANGGAASVLVLLERLRLLG